MYLFNAMNWQINHVESSAAYIIVPFFSVNTISFSTSTIFNIYTTCTLKSNKLCIFPHRFYILCQICDTLLGANSKIYIQDMQYLFPLVMVSVKNWKESKVAFGSTTDTLKGVDWSLSLFELFRNYGGGSPALPAVQGAQRRYHCLPFQSKWQAGDTGCFGFCLICDYVQHWAKVEKDGWFWWHCSLHSF